MVNTKPAPNQPIIRRAEEEDAKDLVRIHTQKSSYLSTLQLPYPSATLWRERLRKGDYVLVAELQGKVVGIVGLEQGINPRIRHVGKIGMTVDENYRGKGIGFTLLNEIISVAETWLGISRIELEVYTDNKPAIALYKKLLFVQEGTLKSNAMRDGVLVDSFMMARIKPTGYGTIPSKEG